MIQNKTNYCKPVLQTVGLGLKQAVTGARQKSWGRLLEAVAFVLGLGKGLVKGSNHSWENACDAESVLVISELLTCYGIKGILWVILGFFLFYMKKSQNVLFFPGALPLSKNSNLNRFFLLSSNPLWPSPNSLYVCKNFILCPLSFSLTTWLTL